MRFRCTACTKTVPYIPFEFEGDMPLCPLCGSEAPAVIPLVDVHFIVMDPRGAILGGMGRQHVACDKRRQYLATRTEFYSATDDPRAVTCPSCKGTRWWQDMAKLFPEIEAERLRKIIDSGSGCCG